MADFFFRSDYQQNHDRKFLKDSAEHQLQTAQNKLPQYQFRSNQTCQKPIVKAYQNTLSKR